MQLVDFYSHRDLSLLFHTKEQIQVKTIRVAEVYNSVGFWTHTLEYNIKNTNLITIDEEAWEKVKTFTFLDSILDEQE